MRDHKSKCFAVLILVSVLGNCSVSADVVTIADIEINPATPTELDTVEIAPHGWIGYVLDISMIGYDMQIDGSAISFDVYFLDSNPGTIRLPIADRWDIIGWVGPLEASTYSVITRAWVADIVPISYRLSDTYSTSFTVFPEPCGYLLAGDLNDDCMVELRDFGELAFDWQIGYDPNDLTEMAVNWLLDCDVTPGDPGCVPK